MTTETIIELSGTPQKTGNPIRDFAKVAETETGSARIGQVYKLKSTMFALYEGQGRSVGIDIYRPVKCATGNLYSKTRIQNNLQRREMGLIQIN